jgi:hypothetical protein
MSSATRGKSLEDARKTRKDMPTSRAITVSCQRDPWLPSMHCQAGDIISARRSLNFEDFRIFSAFHLLQTSWSFRSKELELMHAGLCHSPSPLPD